jgi:hypothetical protein
MAVEWTDVADNAVKIGLGSLITFLGGYLTLKLTQRHESRKERAALHLKEIDIRTGRYIDFLSMSQSLMQTYLFKDCRGDSDDYINYMRIHNEISVTSTDDIRTAAFHAQYAVSLFVTQNKEGDKVALFQGLANAELRKERAALIDPPVAWWKLWKHWRK